MNVGRYMASTARHYPNRLAVVHEGTRLTWSQVNRGANAFANALLRLGVKMGDCVGIYMTNCHQYLELLFGCWKIGAIAVPMNARLHPEEVVYHMNGCRAVVLVFTSELSSFVASISSQLTQRKANTTTRRY